MPLHQSESEERNKYCTSRKNVALKYHHPWTTNSWQNALSGWYVLHLHRKQASQATSTMHLHRIYISIINQCWSMKVCNDDILIRRHSSSNTYYIQTYDMMLSLYFSLFYWEKKLYQFIYYSTTRIWGKHTKDLVTYFKYIVERTSSSYTSTN